METRYYHGNLDPEELADALVAQFDHGNLRAQKIGGDDQIIVQIASRYDRPSGGQTALSVHLRKIEDGVAVQLGQQEWLGVAASLGATVLSALRNPWALLSRLDDLAQDFASLTLSDQVYQVIENVALAAGATFELSERLRRLVCAYCRTANPVGEANCLACGAPLGDLQPRTCRKCGYVLSEGDSVCPQCATPL